jgi:hypothetical protein
VLKVIFRYRKIVFITFLFALCYGGYRAYIIEYFKDMLPAKLEVESTLYAQRDGFKPCGAALFRLSDKTVKQINEQGLAFFKDVNVARHPIYDASNRFKEWKKTPYTQIEFSNGPFIGGGCMKNWGEQMNRKLYEAAKSDSNYRAIGISGPSILVIPSEKIVLIDMFDF